MKVMHKTLCCLLTALWVGMSAMAQNDVNEIYGAYSGSMSTTIEQNGNTTTGSVKRVTFVLSEGENGAVLMTLKNYSIHPYHFEDIALSQNVFVKSPHRWALTQGSAANRYYETQDKTYSISLDLKVTEAAIDADGMLNLSMTVGYSPTVLKHQFKGEKVITGIGDIRSGRKPISAIYDLQGRKVEKPGHGIYIVNGKKVVM